MYRDTLSYDRYRLAEIDTAVRGEPFVPQDPVTTIRRALRAATLHDPDVLRLRARIGGVLSPAQEALAEPGVVERVREVAADKPPYPFPGPSRAELVAAVRG